MTSGHVEPIKEKLSGKITGYRVRWRNPPGKIPNNPSRSFVTKALAQQCCSTVRAHTQVVTPGTARKQLNISLNKFVEIHPHPRHKNQAPKTVEGRASRWNKWISPDLGKMTIRNIEVKDIETLLSKITVDKHFETAKKVREDLCVVWKNAIRLNYASENPALFSISDGVEVLQVPQDTREVFLSTLLTETEVKNLVKAMPEYIRPLVITLFTIGIRIGEASALQVSDLDLAKGTLSVNATRSFAAKKFQNGKSGVRKNPKSVKSRRVIKLWPELIKVLTPLTEGRAGSDPLFTSKNGKNLDPHNFCNREWKHAVEGTTLHAEFTPHDLRHFAASMIYHNCRDMAQVSAILGHANVGITERRYVHLLPEKSVEVANTLEAIWPKGSLQDIVNEADTEVRIEL